MKLSTLLNRTGLWGEKMKGELKIGEMIRTIPDFPKPGIHFKDITPLLKDSEAFGECIRLLADKYRDKNISVIAAAEARGFIIGSALAFEIGAGFVPMRKPGKLPHKTLKHEFTLEYGKDAFEIHQDAVSRGERVLIFDDVLATGGTANAAAQMIEKLGGEIVGLAFLVEIEKLKGRDKLQKHDVFSLIKC